MSSNNEYKQFVESLKTWSNASAFASCECPIPRTDNGWPAIKPDQMDNMQLLYEAMRWRSTAQDTGAGTVGHREWTVYTNELIRRGLMDIDCQQRYDIYKILEKGWNDLPPGPIVVDPTIPDPIVVDPQDNSLLGRFWRVLFPWMKRGKS